MANLKISVLQAAPAEVAAALLVVPHFEGDLAPAGHAAELDSRLGGEIARLLARGDFRGRRDEALLVLPRPGEMAAERVLLVGLGRREEYTMERLRRALGTAVRQAERLGAKSLALTVGYGDRVGEQLKAYHLGQAVAEGVVLAIWEFREYKAPPADGTDRGPLTELVLIARDGEEADQLTQGARYGEVVARAENLARDLASRPGNRATPTHLAEVAREISEEFGLDLTVLDREGMRAEGMGALLAVAQGTEEEPRFIVLEYRGSASESGPIVLIGKGVTFDSGGISIKPADRMEDMKFDMSGAAAVLAATHAIAELRLPVHLITLVPATENLLSGRSYKPGDIIRSHSGKTIEVVNTDAEGRLILADALSYAQRFRPRVIVDAATLTGACVIALGNHAIGLMGNDGGLVDEIRAAGERTGERCWPLPLWEEFRPQLDSVYADLKNSGGRPAGSITAGLFLKEFVGEVPWAHLDIAGTANRDEALPYLRKGATGVPTRLFVEWVRSRVQS